MIAEVFLFLLRFIAAILGLLCVGYTLLSAVRTFVLPRGARDFITRAVFMVSRKMFDMPLSRADSYEDQDRIMALFAPVTLLVLPVVWLIIVMCGYAFLFWAVDSSSWERVTLGHLHDHVLASGAAVLTLGYDSQHGTLMTLLAFSEAAIGLVLVALLIAYLPTIYASFSRRELAVTLLEVRAGSPPSAVELFLRFHRLKRMDRLSALWDQWENWFVDIEESHTSLASLAFFRSPQPHRSWITAAGAVLDAAALSRAILDIPPDPQADLTIRAGYLALRHIADYFDLSYNGNPHPNDPISVSRLEFDMACNELEAGGLTLRADRNQAWRDFAGWRVNYDTVLLKLCSLAMAPYAPWSSDRGLRTMSDARESWGSWFSRLLGRRPKTKAERMRQRMDAERK